MLKRRAVVATISATLFALIAGCATESGTATGTTVPQGETSSGAQQLPPDPETTVVIDGNVNTCETVIGVAECSPEIQEIFDRYKQNIGPFVHSGRLGELSSDKWSFKEAAATGFYACTAQKMKLTYSEFVSVIRTTARFSELPDTTLSQTWKAASTYFCPSI